MKNHNNEVSIMNYSKFLTVLSTTLDLSLQYYIFYEVESKNKEINLV